MAIAQVKVGGTYEMEDKRKLRIIREWTSDDGHPHVAFEVIEDPPTASPPTSFLDCSKRDFLAKASREVKV